MKSMKTLLRLVGTFVLTIITSTSVVACGLNSTVTMNGKIAQRLGLISDAKGTGMQVASLVTTTEAVTWTIPALTTPITANLLLATSTSNSQICYAYITRILNVQTITGSSFDDGIFDKAQLKAITGEVTKIKPTLTKITTSGYSVNGGTFNFQFKADKLYLGDNYTIKLKVETTDVISAILTIIVTDILITDTDVISNPKIAFKENTKIPNNVDGQVVTIKTDGSNAFKQLASLNTLSGLKITAKVLSHSAEKISWTSSDKIIISYKTADIEFANAINSQFKLI